MNNQSTFNPKVIEEKQLGKKWGEEVDPTWGWSGIWIEHPKMQGEEDTAIKDEE